MIHKIVRENGTEIPNIKSCVYKRDINGETNLRVGCVSSANIEVTVFGKKNDAPAPGEKLQFYEMVSGGAWRFIGTFYAEPAITSRMTYKFVAYDKVARLDVDFSARLWELQNAFPMSLYALVSYAATVAGVTLHSSASSALSGITVKKFYADNITCRQIFSWAAELVGKYVFARTDNEQLTFAWYSNATGIRVYPTNTNLPLIIRNPIDVTAPAGTTIYMNVLASNATGYQWQYRTSPNGTWRNNTGEGNNTERFALTLRQSINGYQYHCVVSNSYGSTETDAITVQIDPSGTYVEPTDSPLHYSTETAIAYRQNGLQYENYTVAPVDCVAVFAVDESETSVLYPSSGGDNIYSVYNNLLLTDASSTTLNSVARKIYTALHSITEYRPATMKLFPSENPISTGSIVAVTDAQGFSFATIVMSVVSDGAVDKLKSTGAETYEETDQVNQKSKIVNMASSILRLKKLIVEEIEAIIARIDTIFANEITVTGTLHSDDYEKIESQPFAASGMALDFAERTINGKYFTFDENGTLISRSAFFGDMYFSDAYDSANSTKNEAPYQMLDAQGNVSTNYSSYGTVYVQVYPSYSDIYPNLFKTFSGYQVGEKCTFVYNVPLTDMQGQRYNVRYLLLTALARPNVDTSVKPVVRVKHGSDLLGELQLEYSSVRVSYDVEILDNHEFSLFYVPRWSGFNLNDSLTVEVDLPENVCISLDVARDYYSAWYGYNNNHTYGGTGTYVGTDGISADKIALNGANLQSPYYSNGDSYATSGYAHFPGSIGSLRAYSFTVQTPKSLANISSISVTSLVGRLLGSSGFLGGNNSYINFLNGNYTVTASKRGEYLVRVAIEVSTQMSGATIGALTADVNITLSFS